MSTTLTKDKLKSCQISPFVTRIPQTIPSPKSHRPPTEVSLEAIGRRVRVGDKEGILRYLGPLHFDKGLWCGIELISGHGRNNGTVKGVPYFTCPDDKGLMAPVAKVTVVPASVQEIPDDNVSGPYSILCLPPVKPPENQKKRTNDTFTENERKEATDEESSSQRPTAYLPLNKSCEDLLKESTIEVKRRRTSTCRPDTKLWTHLSQSTPVQQRDYAEPVRFSLELGNIADDQSTTDAVPIEEEKPQKPTSLPQLRANIGHHFANDAVSGINEIENNKRDSLDCDESLGILTPDQMVDFTHYLDCDKLTEKSSNRTAESREQPEEVVGGGGGGGGIDSPNLTEYSLGIIDVDQMHCTFLNLNANAMNLDLSLSAGQTSTRAEETPSPEELPLDTTPIVDALETKNEPPKSKTNQNNNSFITSITSITSLDTGYQGDGEMSRPASRGADNSPLTKRPFPRAIARRPDPMTDSDFYTESDADNHEDNQLKGDRRAQVIDGTLYGVDPQAAADIYANNRENMDSSGVFTDLESGTRNDDQTPSNNVSPSESSKTISEDSQSNVPEPQTQKGICPNETTSPNRTIVVVAAAAAAIKDNNSASKKRVASSPADGPSPVRHQKDQTTLAKKYKMPKRDVASKVKAMLVESNHHHQQQQQAVPIKKPPKKPANRWDHVMNKISKADPTNNKTNLKEVKSRVFEALPAIATGHNSPTNGTKIGNVGGGTSTTTVGNNQASSKSRRVRTRTLYSATPTLKKTTRQSSIHSSMSDLSASATSASASLGSSKKKEAVQVTQVLTAHRLTSKNQRNLAENKKNGNNNSPTTTTIVQNATTTTTAEVKTKRTFLPSRKEPKPTYVRGESLKPTTKGGRTSPSVRSPNVQQQSQPVKPPLKKTATLAAPRTAEALAVLVEHLVFNVGAFEAPRLARQAAKYRLEAQELRSACERLENNLEREKEQSAVRYKKDREELLDGYEKKIAQLTHEFADAELQLRSEKEQAVDRLSKHHDDQLTLLRKELEKLQRSHEAALQILQEENDCIREQIDEKRTQLEQATHESLKLKSDYETKEVRLKEELELLRAQRDKLERAELGLQEKIKELTSENRILREQNDRLLSFGEDKDIAKQEVQSLRVVLELKQNEVTELRKALEEAKQRRHFLEGVEEKAATLQARCEDLEHQLRRKNEYEQTLIQEQQRLHEALQQEANTSKRLHQHNEELMWKLEHNKEIVSKVIEQAEETVFNRSSCNEKHHHQQQQTYGKALERALSFREQRRTPKTSSTAFDEEESGSVSPPTSPKVKGVVEKSDSVSYVLDLDESPDLVASRILRRSFRNTTPPKGASAPAKSPSSNKRPRIRNALSTSASSSSLHSGKRTESERPHSATPARNGYRRPNGEEAEEEEEDDEEEDGEEDVFLWDNQPVSSFGEVNREKLRVDHDEDEVDLKLPALPSEMDKKNGALALPSPKRLAVDPAGCDSSSDEDESTSSSSQL